MQKFTTPLTPDEIRKRLDVFLPEPWSITARKPWLEALNDIARSSKQPEFRGAVGPGWFKLYYNPGYRVPTPAIRGCFTREGEKTTVSIDSDCFLGILPIILITLFFVIAGLNQAMSKGDLTGLSFYILIFLIVTIFTYNQAIAFARTSIKSIVRILELTPLASPAPPSGKRPFYVAHS